MPRQRDYKAEYRRRIERGLTRGQSRSQARGHARASERPGKATPDQLETEPVKAAVRLMNQGESLTAAARSAHVSPERLRRLLIEHHLGKRNGRHWEMADARPRRVPVVTDGHIRTLFVDGFEQAHLAGNHYQAVGTFVRTNDAGLLRPFIGKSVRANGRQYPLETDPNELHRLAAMDMPSFHEIYDITSNS